MFQNGVKVKANIDGQWFAGTVTVSDDKYTQFVDEQDDTRTVIARNTEDQVAAVG